MRQSPNSLHFYAPAVFVALILFDEIDSIFSLSLSTEHSEFAEHVDYTPIELNGYNIDELHSESRDDKLYNFESTLNDVDAYDATGDLFALKKAVSVCVFASTASDFVSASFLMFWDFVFCIRLRPKSPISTIWIPSFRGPPRRS